ncbi:MAG: hypothetical protein Q9167_007927 [Letrouitia subvulpina]
MAGEDATAELPLMRAQDSLTENPETHDDRLIDEAKNSTSPSTFIWALTLTAGISGVISSTLVSINSDLSRPLSTLDKSLITSSTSLFALIASPATGLLADKLGRKHVVLIADVLFALGALWQACTATVVGMIAGRSVVGLAIGGASFVVPLYISELSPSAFRGMLVTVSILFITGGQVVAYVCGWLLAQKEHGWRWMVGLGAVPAVLQFGLFLMLPETPRWLVKAGKVEGARDVLRKVYAVTANAIAEQVLRDIKEEIQEEEALNKLVNPSMSGRDSWPSLTNFQRKMTELLFVGGNRRALIIACMLQGLQQLCELIDVLFCNHFLPPRLYLANSNVSVGRLDQLFMHLDSFGDN